MQLEAATTTDVTLEEITSSSALEQLRPEWAALWARCPSATPFQSPAWLISWWRCFGSGDLRALVLRQAGRLVGLAPLFIHARKGSSARAVRLIGTGNTDYLDVLLEPGAERAGMREIFDHLNRRQHQWDVCDFQQLRPGSPLLDAAPPAAWSGETAVQDACPVLALPDRLEDSARSIPAGFLKKLRYYRRRTERCGAVRVEQAGEHNFEELFEALLRLHGARWAEKDESGVLDGKAVRRFHRLAAEGLLAHSVLRLCALRLDEQIVAVYYGFTHRRRAYYYLSGFDPEFARLSLGHQIVHYAIREAIREDAQSFDFLRGQEEYKYRWGAEDCLNRRRRLHHTPGPAR